MSSGDVKRRGKDREREEERKEQKGGDKGGIVKMVGCLKFEQ